MSTNNSSMITTLAGVQQNELTPNIAQRRLDAIMKAVNRGTISLDNSASVAAAPATAPAAAPAPPAAAAAPAAAPAAATTSEVVSSVDKIKTVLKTEFAGKTHVQNAQLLKEILEVISTGPFITQLRAQANSRESNTNDQRTARIQTFMENKEGKKYSLLSGGRRRKSRKVSRKSQRKSRKTGRK